MLRMSFKILITGPPRCGKSTLIRKLIDHLKENYMLYGFLTPEVRKNGKRIGFDVKDINSRKNTPLARKGDYNSEFTLGSYKVFIEQFNTFLSKSLVNLKGVKGDQNHSKPSILIIDEIGKMELFSELFQSKLKEIFSSNLSVIATIGKHMNHPLKEFILNIPKVKLFSLTRNNQKDIFEKIIQIVKD